MREYCILLSHFQLCPLLNFLGSPQLVLLLDFLFFLSLIIFIGVTHQNTFPGLFFFSVKFLCKPHCLCSWAIHAHLGLSRAVLPDCCPTVL